MARYVALLRGVNVGGKKLLMADFKAALDAAGARDVATYVQSGNAVFTSTSRKPTELEAAIEAAIDKRCGVSTSVVVRSAAQMTAIVDGNPFAKPGRAPNTLHATLLATKPSAARVNALEPPAANGEEWSVADRVVYLYFPNGYGTTKLSNAYWEKQLGVVATTRNWRTVTTLLSMVSQS